MAGQSRPKHSAGVCTSTSSSSSPLLLPPLLPPSSSPPPPPPPPPPNLTYCANTDYNKTALVVYPNILRTVALRHVVPKCSPLNSRPTHQIPLHTYIHTHCLAVPSVPNIFQACYDTPLVLASVTVTAIKTSCSISVGALFKYNAPTYIP